MKKLLILLLIFLASCGGVKYISPTREYIITNIDSICLVDTLPESVNLWSPHVLKDYESGEKLIQYFYIKDSIIYIRTDSTIIKRL